MSARDAHAVEDPPAPDPVTEDPPADRFCDLVLNGGVASGVVYPWALIELARHYRFRSIGGNSVGAMAAAIAAAGEYGRCIGVEDAFEPLRRFPLKLAEEQEDGSTKMLRLFQPNARLRRLFKLFLDCVHNYNPKRDRKPTDKKKAPRRLSNEGLVFLMLWRYGFGWVVIPLGVLALLLAPSTRGPWVFAAASLLGIVGAVFLALIFMLWIFYRDLQALAENDYGLCTGRGQEEGQEGLVEWLHRGIQLAAGRGEDDPPLTFADLWAAPRFGKDGPGPLPGGLQPLEAGIDLQMFASNVTLGRPIRLPLNDANTRLFYHPKEWERYFPPYLMDELEKASRPYAPVSRGDPDPATVQEDSEEAELMRCLRELPSGGMPIVMAARLSLCFPVLFSSVRVYAIDYEAPEDKRRLRRCLISDGGLCSNFPIHLFDAAHPQWPTFAFLLDSRLLPYPDEPVWRPVRHLQGRADNWLRFVPGAEDGAKPRGLVRRLGGWFFGMIVTMKDWNDRVTGRLPQVRNRIVRLALQDGEGQLNLDMLPETILRMADAYGTTAGKMLVEAFVPDANGAQPAWREHLYVRSMIELRSLREHVRGYADAVSAGGSTMPLRQILDEATQDPPLRSLADRPDPTAARLTPAQREALERAVRAVEALEAELSACERDFGPYIPVLEPVLHLRPPL